jgi:nucleoside-diphosphate-sugar epimerase
VILVTGANGFVGKALCNTLRMAGLSIRAAVRDPLKQLSDAESIIVESIGASTDWAAALNGVQAIVHLAARVHVMDERAADPLDEFRRMNVDGTVNLARQAAAAGVKRFVFLSSIKVNGESTQPGCSFSADDKPSPEDPYGISKYEAELAIWKVAEQTGMEVVVIRPPLVYGPGVKANFAAMMRWLARGLPLPLGAVTDNRRSLVALDNLVDFIVTCLNHPAAANQTFLVSDGEDLSTADLLKRMGLALGKPSRLFFVPKGLLRFGAAVVNKSGLYQRLCGSLQMDISKTQRLLDWKPPLSVDEGLRRAAQGLRG